MIKHYCDNCKEEIVQNEPHLRIAQAGVILKDLILCQKCYKSVVDILEKRYRLLEKVKDG